MSRSQSPTNTLAGDNRADDVFAPPPPTPAAAPNPATSNAAAQTPAANAAGEPAPPAVLEIRFRHQSGQDVVFKMKPTTKLGKAMDAFSAKMERPRHTMRFIFEGQRVLDTSTPEQLEIENESIVDVYEEQIGGGAASSFP